MKHYLLLPLLLLVFFSKSQAQKNPQGLSPEKLKEEFKKVSDYNVFVQKYSDYVWQLDTLTIYRPQEYDNAIDSLCFAAKKGDVLGFFDAYTEHTQLIKVIGSTDAYFMHVSHILIKNGKVSDDEMTAKGNLILDKLKAGEPFESLAMQYGDDGTAERGGELGWFGQNVMVSDFENAILAHKKGDCFLVWTAFGLHVVKITEASKKGKQQVYIVRAFWDKL